MNDLDPRWSEYDAAANWCAERNLKGLDGDPLPEALSAAVYTEIMFDPEAFRQRVRDCAYGRAMNKLNLPEE